MLIYHFGVQSEFLDRQWMLHVFVRSLLPYDISIQIKAQYSYDVQTNFAILLALFFS